MNNTMMNSMTWQCLSILGIHYEEHVPSNLYKNVHRTKIYFKFKTKNKSYKMTYYGDDRQGRKSTAY
jgi:hypothetical protein